MHINLVYLKKQIQKRKDQKLYEIKPIGSAIRFKRKELNLTLEEASEGICSVSYLSKLENNQIQVGERFVDQLIERFDLTDTIDVDLGAYERYKETLIDHVLNDTQPPQLEDDDYRIREDHQAYFILFIYAMLEHDEQEALRLYGKMRIYVSNLKDDELAVFLVLVSQLLMIEHRFSDAYELISVLFHLTFELDTVSLLVTKQKLNLAFILHKDRIITDEYQPFIHHLLEHELYPLINQIKSGYLMYLAYHEEPAKLKKKLLHLNAFSDKDKDRIIFKALYYKQQYETCIKRVEHMSIEDKDTLLYYLLSLDHIHHVDHIRKAIIQYQKHPLACRGIKLILTHLTYKYHQDQHLTLAYLRRDILGLKHLTDHYEILEYFMHDVQVLFAKHQFYKEALQTMNDFSKRLKALKQADKYLIQHT